MKIRLSQIKTTPLSAPPEVAEEKDLYLDDGTNTGTGRPGWRIYLNGQWVDIGSIDIENIDIDGGTF